METLIAFFLPFLLLSGAAHAASDPRDSQSPYGVLDFLMWDHSWNHHHYSDDKPEHAIKLMKEAGVGFVRLDFLWEDVQPAPDKWDFKKYDRLVELLIKNDIKILGLLNYNVSWDSKVWNQPPDREHFAVYAKTVVARYKKKVKYWEVWNEPNQDIYWSPQDHMSQYTLLLKKVYPVIKKEDPSALVLLGGLSGKADVSLQEVYNEGGKNYFDIVNTHPFVNPLTANPVGQLERSYKDTYEVMKDNGDADKEIWFTEIGCPGAPKLATANWWLGPNPTEKQQAEWVEKLYGEPLKWKGVKKVFWAFFRDTPNHFQTGTDYFGLVREDFSKKPAFESYKKMTGASKE